jgi:cell division protein FtsQ
VPSDERPVIAAADAAPGDADPGPVRPGSGGHAADSPTGEDRVLEAPEAEGAAEEPEPSASQGAAPSAAPNEPAASVRRARPRRLVAAVAAAAIAVAAALVAATYTPLFSADAIRVRGIHHLTKGEILRASGLERGVNVFHLDAEAVEARVERDPWVAEATLTKELPGTVVLTIRERVPVAVVNDGSVERLVADDGGLLGIGAPSDLPRIVANEGATTTDPAAVRSAATAVSAMRPDVRRQIAFVYLLPEGELALELHSGVPIAYGAPEDAASKAQALAALLRYAERTGERYSAIDVSVPTAPAGTLVGS